MVQVSSQSEQYSRSYSEIKTRICMYTKGKFKMKSGKLLSFLLIFGVFYIFSMLSLAFPLIFYSLLANFGFIGENI